MEKTKIALVTGALGGIGTAIAKSLIAENYFVIAVASHNRSPQDFDQWLNDE